MDYSYDKIRMQVRGTKIASQLLILCIIFLLPEVLISIGKPHLSWVPYVRPLPYIAIFYLNYSFLVDKFLLKKNTRYLFFVINFLLIIGFVVAIYSIFHLFGIGPRHIHKAISNIPFIPRPGMMPPPPPEGADNTVNSHILRLLSFLYRDGVLMVLTVALSIALKFGEKWSRWDRMQTQLIAERQETELKNLKNQLNPHFLFNTLNNIYSLIMIAPDKAQKSVHDLSNLLRYTLYDNNDKEVPLKKDLDFIENYIELMRLRLTPNVDLKVNIPHTGIDNVEIAPLMFISMIENAFKHGVVVSKPSFIHVDIKLIDNQIQCIVENTYFPKNKEDKSGSGIGIANLKRQLSILYPDRHTFSLCHDEEKFTAKLFINLSQPQ